MKKIIFLLLFFPCYLFAQTETTFMGIPISYSYEQFNSELSKKSTLTKVEGNNDYTMYNGTFAGIENCNIFILKEGEEGAQMAVVKDLWYATIDVRAVKIMYDNKYGAPMDRTDEDKVIIYTYKNGDDSIELLIAYEDVRIPSKPTQLQISYYPRKLKKFLNEDI